ncbi:hypothetical protein [Tepidimonas sp.]|uniref:hypothetical protein n=1 Tax=Tepidimonas sp. TaxID=2002775 RepID=UPI00391AD137
MTDDFIDGEPDPFSPDVVASQDAETRRLSDDQANLIEQQMRRCAEAYRRIFVDGKPMDGDVDIVMLDLAAFCYGFKSTYRKDEREHVLLTGRHQVWQRIMDLTRLDTDALFRKYSDVQRG